MGEATVASTWFNEQGELIREFPDDCIMACYHSGSCDRDCKEWREKLGFSAPRNKAVSYVKSTGGWTQEELDKMDDEELDVIVLWLACGDIQEQGEWFGLCM